MGGAGAQTARLGQVLDYLYVPPSGSAPEEALASVLDLAKDEVRVGPDTNETTLILARRGVQMAGRFVRFTPSPDPKQLGHIVPVGISTLDHDTRCRIVGLIKSGYCLQPPPDVPIAAEGDEV